MKERAGPLLLLSSKSPSLRRNLCRDGKITRFKGGSGLAGPCGYATCMRMDGGFHGTETKKDNSNVRLEERGKEDERGEGEWYGLLLLTCLASVFVMRECFPLLSLRREEVGCRVL